MTASYYVGIDLGTTNIVMAFAPVASPEKISVFPIPQLVAAGQVESLPQLPASRYHYQNEIESNQTQLPWNPGPVASRLPQGIVGTWASELGRATPERLLHSAKSWLACEQANEISLPWRAGESVEKISPLDASAAYLEHLRLAWEHQYPEAPLNQQCLVLTVPASFDDIARALTIEAAKQAGLDNLLLMEEPLAACHNWLRDPTSVDVLAQHKRMLVCDIGGGTSDFTLIDIDSSTPPRLRRTGVGEHLMLGGDNMDLALSAQIQKKLANDKPTHHSIQAVLQQCRVAKETLLSNNAPDEVAIVNLGRGSSLFASVQRSRLTRKETEQLVLDGFFPQVSANSTPAKRKTAFRELGLPYPADPAITRHLAQFLQEQQTEKAKHEDDNFIPDLLLLNGNPFNSPMLIERISNQLQQWRTSEVTTVRVDEPGFAVAKGAAYYACLHFQQKRLIESDTARSYFVIAEGHHGKEAICVLPKGTPENTELELLAPAFNLQCGQSVQFEVVSRADGTQFSLGEHASLSPAFHHLPKLMTKLDGSGLIKVHLTAKLTELGLLSLTCRDEQQHRDWPLEFNLRRHEKSEEAGVDQRFQKSAGKIIDSMYGSALKQGSKTGTLRKQLEKATKPREDWTAGDARGVAEKLIEKASKRRRSMQHERGWFNMTGFAMRPGFGLPGDGERMAKLWPLYQHGLQFQKDEQSWREWWIFWRRLAAGLDEAQQLSVLDEIGMVLVPGFSRVSGSKPRQRYAIDERIRLIGALERIPVEAKQQIGSMLLTLLEKKQHQSASAWALARIGARKPAYVSGQYCVDSQTTIDWLTRLLTLDWKTTTELYYTAASLARFIPNSKPIPDTLIEEVVKKIKQGKSSMRWLNWIVPSEESQGDTDRLIWGDSLPSGLKLLS